MKLLAELLGHFVYFIVAALFFVIVAAAVLDFDGIGRWIVIGVCVLAIYALLRYTPRALLDPHGEDERE